VVEALTRGDDESYEDFVRRAAQDPIARAVKGADVADNADEARLALLSTGQAARLRSKYARAAKILNSYPAYR
jgi:guanosine-3',5'-bis(diphosphate) 3'-pyrophosphohydrolase